MLARIAEDEAVCAATVAAVTMTITSTEAAEILGLKVASIRSLARRGDLMPVRPGAHPLRFRREAVVELEWARRSAMSKAAHERAARRLRSMRDSATIRVTEEVRPGCMIPRGSLA